MAVTILGLIVLGVALIWVVTRLSGRGASGTVDSTSTTPLEANRASGSAAETHTPPNPVALTDIPHPDRTQPDPPHPDRTHPDMPQRP
ncbi:MAG: hypothetical protein WCA30_08220 [Dermatophilaceae bacterium]